MAFFSLYEMVYYGYEDEDQQFLFIKTLSKNISYLKKANFVSKSEKILADVILWNINIGKTIIILRKK
jgi:hypothetical protein